MATILFASVQLSRLRDSQISIASLVSQTKRMSSSSIGGDGMVVSVSGVRKVEMSLKRKSRSHVEDIGRGALMGLPIELQLTIFDFLDKCSSTCLGLTCKQFYAIHWARHGTVPLNEYQNNRWLYQLLTTYMAPRIPNVVMRNRQVEIIFVDVETAELSGDEKERWGKWIGRTAGRAARASRKFLTGAVSDEQWAARV